MEDGRRLGAAQISGGSLSSVEANDFGFERNTPSTANGLELMDGGGDSPAVGEV